ncbi:MAG TPA: hypothetical protein VGN64_14920, partial [Dyadobacter sp.]|nr:hypothetical protein [Dyadobacter sp.]
MTPSFFKMRGLFDFSPHPYDIGNPVLQTWYYNDNHVFNKIYRLPESDYRPFYDYHLKYYLAKNPEAELDFFQNLWEIVSDRRDYYKRQEFFSTKQKQARQNLVKIKQFQSFLISMDQWQTSLPL